MTWSSTHALGLAYSENSDVATNIIGLLEIAMHVQEEVLTLTHLIWLESQYNLESKYLDDGQVKKVIEMLGKDVQI
jgi:hypothetical protein